MKKALVYIINLIFSLYGMVILGVAYTAVSVGAVMVGKTRPELMGLIWLTALTAFFSYLAIGEALRRLFPNHIYGWAVVKVRG